MAKLKAEIAREILHRRNQPLDVFFAPEHAAVIGATEAPGSVGRNIVENLVQNPFGGTVYPVNPKRPSVLGIKAYPSVSAVPERPDLAIIVTPAPTVPGIVRECAALKISAAIIISAGFKEAGAQGVALEKEILEIARSSGMRIVGPNCLGVMCPTTGFNGTFAKGIALPGSVGFISQSGALCAAILDWSRRENVGFSHFISIGSMLDVDWGDLIDALGSDPATKSILIYMESVGDAKSFMSAAREVALTKPIIILKAGRTESAAKAAASHTGSLAGSDDVLEAAFRRSGVLRVKRIADLFYMSEVLAKQPPAYGPKLTILTNAGGPGVLATDALVGEGGELAKLSPDTIAALDKFLPVHWSHGNPIDVLGDASPERYAKSLEIAAKDPSSDGLLVILTPQSMTDPTKIAQELASSDKTGKPVLASWLGGNDVAEGTRLLTNAGIPNFPYPDTAVRAFGYMWSYQRNLKSIYETPVLPKGSEDNAPDRGQADALVQKALKEGRTLLTELESKSLLAAYHIPTVATELATTDNEAVRLADKIGYPVVLKLNSLTLTHKTDVGGVQLNLRDANAVRQAFNAIQASVTEQAGAQHFQGVTVQPMVRLSGYELILGSSLDVQFGPVILFGSGGQLVEVFKDKALGLPPLSTTLARRLMEDTKIYTALKGVRGRKAVDLAALEQLLVGFSQLVVEQPWIKEIDINPLLASPEGLLALDARVVLHAPNTPEDKLTRPVIRPYPSNYISHWTMKDGSAITFRPIRAEDEPLMTRFHETLSEQSVYRRYLQQISLSQRIGHERLVKVCYSDYDRELALVADRRLTSGTHEILAVARLSKDSYQPEGDIAVLVSDHVQRHNLGLEMARRLIDIARAEKLKRLKADILVDNIGMQKICERLGFKMGTHPTDNLITAELSL